MVLRPAFKLAYLLMAIAPGINGALEVGKAIQL